jgi:hypothetical protein
MTHQSALFHDSIYDALAADVAAIGGVKKTAPLLWPSNADAAGRLRACLSTGHAQKLDAEEILSIKRFAKDVGSFAAVTYEAQVLAFKIEWIKPDDEKAELQRQVIEMGKKLEAIARRLQK